MALFDLLCIYSHFPLTYKQQRSHLCRYFGGIKCADTASLTEGYALLKQFVKFLLEGLLFPV